LETAVQILEGEQTMSSTILPEIVRCNLPPMRRALDEYEAQEPTPAQADELFFLCAFLADALKESWAMIQGGSRQGMEGRKLLSLLQEVSGQIEEVHSAFERLQKMVQRMPNYRGAAGSLSRLTTDVVRMEQARKEVAALRDWLNVPPPPVDVEGLKSLESGPFARLTDLQGRRGTQGS
jgi:hypothetical protein